VDSKEYINSGAIEAYVMGLATPEESAELEMLCRQYPEIRRALRECEESLENAALAQASPPPARVKNALDSALTFKKEPAAQAPVYPIPQQRGFPWRSVAAAAIVMLIASGILNYYFYNRYRKADEAYASLLAQTESLQASNKAIQARLDDMESGLTLMMSSNVQKVEMPGVGSFAQYHASVYWNHHSKEVFLSPGTLPPAPDGKQYQLWAIVDGKPVDAGMLDQCHLFCRMKPFDHASAFAITLEPAGGKTEPTMDQLYVMGQTRS
jgi:anti-sigma-K factor RskA